MASMTAELIRQDIIRDAAAPPEFATEIEALRNETSAAALIDHTGKLAAGIYFTAASPEFLAYKSDIEWGIDPAKIRAAVNLQDYGTTDPATDEFNRLVAAVSAKEQITRTIIRKVVGEGENSLNLSATEKTVLLASLDMADQYDLLYLQWHKNVVAEPLAKELRDMGKDQALKLLRSQGIRIEESEYLYSVYKASTDGKITAEPYAAAFPGPITELSRLHGKMIADLEKQATGGDTQAVAYVDYFRALDTALTSVEPEKHEQLWKTVDKKWMQIRGRMQPVHMMESYADSLGFRVEPEFQLAFPDDRFDTVNQMIVETKQQLIAGLQRNYADKKTLPGSVTPMESSVIGFYRGVLSGRRLSMRAAGQNVPNREDIRMQDGVKIFLDSETMYLRWQIQRQLLVKVFGEEYVKEKFSDENAQVEVAAGIFLPGHEVGHNAFISEGVRVGLEPDIYKAIEETKADLSILSIAPEYLDQNRQELLVKDVLATGMRSLAAKKDESKAPYFNASLLELRHMQEAQILRIENGKWIIDTSPKKLQSFFCLCRASFSHLADIYDRVDSVQAAEFILFECVETPVTAEIEKVLGIENPGVYTRLIHSSRLSE